MRRTRSWNSSPHRRPQRQPQSSFTPVVLPPLSAFFTATSPLPYARPHRRGSFGRSRHGRRRRYPLRPRLAPPHRSFVCRDGLLYLRSPRGDRLCIPEAGGLCLQVLQELHSTPLGGHFGRDKTLALARCSVWWPCLSAAVEEYITTCPSCQRVKADHLLPAGLLFPLPVPTRRGGCISLDFIELPTARSGHDFVQVHIDLLTGRVWLVPTNKTATAETAARNFVASVFRDVGLPDVLVSDRDTRFTSAFWTSDESARGVLGVAHLRLPAPPQHYQQGRARQRRHRRRPALLRQRPV